MVNYNALQEFGGITANAAIKPIRGYSDAIPLRDGIAMRA